jgi:hypothetical protein
MLQYIVKTKFLMECNALESGMVLSAEEQVQRTNGQAAVKNNFNV